MGGEEKALFILPADAGVVAGQGDSSRIGGRMKK